MEKQRIATMTLSCVLLFSGPGREGHAQAPTPGRITKSVLVLSLRSAAQAQRCSNATLAAELFTDANSVQAYYAENSYGLASISGTVSGPYTIAMGDTCDPDKYQSAADTAAAATSEPPASSAFSMPRTAPSATPKVRPTRTPAPAAADEQEWDDDEDGPRRRPWWRPGG